jgi:hypothetical protein
MDNKTKERKEDKKSKFIILRRITKLWSFFLIIIGLFIIFISLLLRPEDISNISDFKRILFNFIEFTGITLFFSGIFSIFLQIPDWQDYFEERLRNIVLEQSYLDSLKKHTLWNLQINTLKSYYEIDDIDKEGSFLLFFHKYIMDYIKSPYRYDVKDEFVISEFDDDGFWINDTISYHCRMIGGNIQKDIKWIPEPEEFLDFGYINISLRKKNNLVIKLSKDGNNYSIDDNNVNRPLTREEFYQGITFSLENYNEDGLLVEIKARYKIQRGRFICWTMAHLTKGFELIIRYPETLRLIFDPNFLNYDRSLIEHDEKTFLSMKYNEWLLPFSGVGIVFSFINKT